MIMVGADETDLIENSFEDLVPSSSALLESVESLEELENFIVIADLNVARGWFHVNDFVLV